MRLVNRRGTVFGTLLVLLVSSPLGAERDSASAESTVLRQPASSRHGTVLSSRPGKASVTIENRVSRVRLRRNERLTTIAEVADGWAAAGIREGANGSRVIVVQEAGAGVERLSSPPGSTGRHRLLPRLLVEPEGLGGVAWLEGERRDRMEVRAAQWTGGGWTPAAVVSASGPGSQTGLSQAVLADGSWLLVWSRFDGVDNEIYWSRWAGNAWSVPQPIEAGDRVPDVTPTLLASGEGALLAWSEYTRDGYRVRAAAFEGGIWRAVELPLGSGALYPELRRQPQGTYLLYRSALEPGWGVAELNSTGGVLRISKLRATRADRPILRPSGSAMGFQWFGARPVFGSWERRR